MRKSSQKGFTLIELMIVIAIIGILAVVAIPQFSRMTGKARYTEVVTAATQVKKAVEGCFQTRGNFVIANCDDWAEVGLAQAELQAAPEVGAIAINAADAVITAQNNDNVTFVLTPTVDAATNMISWTQGGTCIAEGLC